MSEGAPAKRSARWVVGLAVALGAFCVMFALRTQTPHSPLPPAKTADVSATDRRDHHFDVSVPQSSPESPISLREETVKQGEVIEFSVTSPRAGAVVVHGLLEPRPVVVNGRVTVAFRAIYTGRFPLHFHGDDGSHFELMALNVMPSGKKEGP